MIAEKYYSPKEVANLLGCGVRVVYDYINEGKLTAANLSKGGGRPNWRIPHGELNRFIDEISREEKYD